MKFYKAFLCAITLFAAAACTVRHPDLAELREGMTGQVTYAEGNMMPGPGQKTSAKGVQRMIYIYEVATASDAEGTAPLFTKVRSKLVAQVKTDTAGNYTVKLKPGRYSVFSVEEEGKLFSSISNDKEELSPAEVLPNKVLKYDILVNYKAVY